MKTMGGPTVINPAMEIFLDESTKPENPRGLSYVVPLEVTDEHGLLLVLLKGAKKGSRVFYVKKRISRENPWTIWTHGKPGHISIAVTSINMIWSNISQGKLLRRIDPEDDLDEELKDLVARIDKFKDNLTNIQVHLIVPALGFYTQ